MAYTSIFEDISGQPSAGRLTVEGFFGNVPAAAASCGLNGIGGLIAGRLDSAASHKWPKNPAMGPFLIFLFAIVLKAVFLKMDDMGNVIREIAAGMAGWCGDDVWYGVRNFFRPQFSAGRSYSSGDIVKHEGKLYKAKKDVPYPPQKVPGTDGDYWEQMQEAAQGYRVEDLKQYAQAFVSDPDRIKAIIDDVTDDLVKKGDVQNVAKFKADFNKTFNEVIAQFHQA